MSLSPQPRNQGYDAELARIEAAYRDRDRVGAGAYRFANPGYAFYLQGIEWSLLSALRRAGVELDGARLLDIGCGTGYFTHRLMELGAGTATGVDLMPERIEAARRRYPQARFVRADAAQLPFAAGEFDLVTQFTCLSSVLDRGLRRGIATEIWRVVRPGGAIVSYDLQPPPWPVRTLRRLGKLRRSARGLTAGAATPTTPISAEELCRLFPGPAAQYRSVGLAFGLCAIAARSRLAAELLASVPVLREHAVGILIKPAGSDAAG